MVSGKQDNSGGFCGVELWDVCLEGSGKGNYSDNSKICYPRHRRTMGKAHLR